MNTISAPRKRKKPVAKSADKDKREYLLVCHKPCDQCLFSKKKLVDDFARDAILENCEEKDIGFICHKHSIRAGELKGVAKSKAHRTYCHGYWTRFRAARLVFRLADMLGAVRFVDFKGKEVERGKVSDTAD